MKKFISVALVLAMVLCLFAGCNQEPAAEAGSGLADAKEYLYTIYKDDPTVTTADYTLVGVVAIDGVSFNVSWAVDNSAIAIVPGDKTVTVDLPDASETEIDYTLTATITDAKGATETVTFTRKMPAIKGADVSDGDKIVLFNAAEASYVTGTDYLYTSSSGSQKHELLLTANKAEALPMTVQTNDNGTVSFIAEGQYLFADGTHAMFVAEQGEFTQFVLEPAEGGQFIRCATAEYGGKPQYLELYGGYMTCYGMNAEKAGIYTFELQEAGEAAGKLTASAPVEEPDPVEPAEAQLPPVTEIAAGTAYKFGVIQVNTGNTIYVTGEVDGRYLVTTTDIAAAADVYAEAAEGGYKFYIVVDGVNSYLDIYNNADGKTSVQYSAEGDVFTFNAECGNWFTNFEGTDFYLGCYNNFETISASKTSYINAENAGISQFPAGFFSVAQLPPVSEVVAGTAYKLGMIQVNTGNTVYVSGAVDGRYLSTTTDKAAAADVYVEAAEGGYKIYIVVDGVNSYLDIYNNADGKVSLQYSAEGDVFAYNAECGNWVVNFEGTDYYVGTYNNFETVSASKTSYINAENAGFTQFPAGFFTAE